MTRSLGRAEKSRRQGGFLQQLQIMAFDSFQYHKALTGVFMELRGNNTGPTKKEAANEHACV